MGVKYENRTLGDLKSLAKKKGMTGVSGLNKKKLINSLRKSRSPITRKSKSKCKRGWKKNRSTGRCRKIKRPRNIIGPLKKGTLRDHGYSSKDSVVKRRKAIRKAVRAENPLAIFRKLNAVYVLNKNRNPSLSKKFLADRNYVKKQYMN